MSNNKQPVDKHDEKANCITEQSTAYRADTGLGGGLVGAVIGGLVGRRFGGVFGAVVGTVAGALAGKGTAERVNRTVEAIVDAAKSVSEGVDESVNSVKGVGNALKDTVEEVKPSLVGVAETAKDTAEEVKPSLVGVIDALKDAVESVKPSIVGAANSVAAGVNHSVKSVADVLKDTVEEVKTSVVGVVDTVKGTGEEVNPSGIVVEDTAKTTVEEVNPFIGGVVNSVAESGSKLVTGDRTTGNVVNGVADRVNHSIQGERHVSKNVVEQVNPSPSVIPVEVSAKITADEVKLPDHHKGKLYDEQLVRAQTRQASQEHPLTSEVNEQTYQTLKPLQQSENIQEKTLNQINSKNLQQKRDKLAPHLQKTARKVKQQKIQIVNKKNLNLAGIIVGAATIIFTGITWGFSAKPKLVVTQSPESNQVLRPTQTTIAPSPATKPPNKNTPSPTAKSPKTIALNPRTKPPKTIADGWIFIGNINKVSASSLGGKPLIKGSQLIDSPIVPSVGSIVSVSVRPGVALRKNKPQEPDFNYKKQKVLAILKRGEKLKIIRVEAVTPSTTTRPTTKVWAEVDRCGSACK